VTESGLTSAAEIEALRAVGYRGFLIGETFMRNSRPEKACAALVQQLRHTEAVTLL
jgi:indole-3-glycerol phosphate synthase